MANFLTDSLKNKFNGKSINLADTAKSLFKNHLIDCWITPSSAGGKNIDLKLDIIGDEVITADCDVTDHYVESNVFRQDQIALKPKTYQVSGEVGELVWYQKSPLSQTIGQVAQRLEGVMSFLPIRSKSFNQMKNTVMKASQWVDTASNAVSRLSSLVGKFGFGNNEVTATTNQQQAYLYLTEFRDNRQLVNVTTPWGILKNCVITNLEFRQPKETKDKSYITITFKEFREVSIQTVPFDASKFQGNAAFENQPLAPQGKTSGESASISETASEDEIYKVTGTRISGTAEKANIEVDVANGKEDFTLYYTTGKTKDLFCINNTTGKEISGNEMTPIIRASKKTLAESVDKASKGFVTGE